MKKIVRNPGGDSEIMFDVTLKQYRKKPIVVFATQMDEPFKPNSAEGDHFKPQSKGGETTPENQVNACRECNGSGGKGAKEVGTEWQPSNPNDRVRERMREEEARRR